MKSIAFVSSTLVFFLAAMVGCSSTNDDESNPNGTGGSGGTGLSDAGPDTSAGGESGVGGTGGSGATGGFGGAGPEDAGPDATKPLPGSGCPSTTGNKIKGVVRLSTLHATPEPTGPSVVVKLPCGREVKDPSKATCGKAPLHVFLCSTADCSAAADPIRSYLESDASLVQPSFDSVAFEFCGVESGTHYILPFLDHDESSSITNFDWTMGIKNIADPKVQWPARVHGYELDVKGDVALGESLVPTNPDASPVVIDYFYYDHPTPPWTSENAWLFLASSLHPDVAVKSVGIRALDLQSRSEVDQVPSTTAMDGFALADPDGKRYESDLEKLAYHDGVAYLATTTPGVILTVRFANDGTIEQGNSIDLRKSGLNLGSDVMHQGVVVQAHGKSFLVIANAEMAGKPLPHQPANPLMVVDLSGLASGDVTTATLVNKAVDPVFDKVRFDELASVDGLLFAAETGQNSRARQNDGLNRLWAFTLDADGKIGTMHTYDGPKYNSEGDVPECGSKEPYRRAGLWAGTLAGKTHVMLGNLRTIALWQFATPDPKEGKRIQEGSGVNATDLRLDDYSVGYSLMRPSPDGKRLYVFGDCKSRWLAVRPKDWAGDQGTRTQSRRRIAVLDLEHTEASGLPKIDLTVGDTATAPDIVRESLSSPDKTLDKDRVGGIGMDCRGVLWDLYDAFGYQNIAGNTFGSDCVINKAADAVVTKHHIYVIGEGSVGFGTTGLGVSSEVLVLDLATGREVLDPSWSWFYEGSSYKNRYGYFGVTLGDRDTTETSKGLFFLPKP